MKNPLVSSYLVVLLLAISSSHGAVVESFDGPGQIAATGDPLASSTSQITNNPGDFENRRFGIPFGGGRMETTLGSSGLSYSYLNSMATGLNKLGYFEYESGSGDLIDLMGSGESVLRFTFSDLVLSQQISFQINVWSATRGDSVQVWIPAGTQSEAFLDVPFSRFEGVDFSQVDRIRISGGRFSSGTSFVLDSVTTVPESSVLSIAVLGCLAAFRRRR